MKTCIKCKIEYELDQFSFKSKTKGTRHSYCRLCQREYVKEHYNRNKNKYIARARKNSPDYRLMSQEFIFDYLSTHPCVRCGESNVLVLDFHHRSNKDRSVSQMCQHSITKITNEIKKCDVLCANCHRIETHKERNTYKYKRSML